MDDPRVLAANLTAAARRCAAAGLSALVVSPGTDLRWLCGYDAVPLVRLTALVVGAGEPFIVVPRLEVLAAAASPLGDLGVAVHSYGEGDDGPALMARLLNERWPDREPRTVAVDDRMWAVKAFALQTALKGTCGEAVTVTAAAGILAGLRMVKSDAEVSSLAAAAAAIDAVHARVPSLLQPGRTEREVARLLAEQVLAAGHVRVDFIIVAAGENAASPHHEPGDRVLRPGDPVIVDIGGTMPDGYRSDETRTYALAPVDPEFAAQYAVLYEAQQQAVAGVSPGVPRQAVDAIARSRLTEAGLGEAFIHRTGHGIGLDTHEQPYLAVGEEDPLLAGMVFSVEPGFYLPGRWGARLEDIVVCTPTGGRSLTLRPRELCVVG